MIESRDERMVALYPPLATVNESKTIHPHDHIAQTATAANEEPAEDEPANQHPDIVRIPSCGPCNVQSTGDAVNGPAPLLQYA
jgi:hypothetical protein